MSATFLSASAHTPGKASGRDGGAVTWRIHIQPPKPLQLVVLATVLLNVAHQEETYLPSVIWTIPSSTPENQGSVGSEFVKDGVSSRAGSHFTPLLFHEPLEWLGISVLKLRYARWMARNNHHLYSVSESSHFCLVAAIWHPLLPLELCQVLGGNRGQGMGSPVWSLLGHISMGAGTGATPSSGL